MSVAFYLFSIFVPTVYSVPSVWSCPFINPIGPIPPGLAPIGEDCPSDSFIHYYSCCDDNPFQCCFHFETWAIVVFGILLLVLIVSSLFVAGKLLMTSNFASKQPPRRP